MQDHLQNPQSEPNCSGDEIMDSSMPEAATPVFSSASATGFSGSPADSDPAKDFRNSMNPAVHADEPNEDGTFSGDMVAENSERPDAGESRTSDDTAASSVEEKYSGSSDASIQAPNPADTLRTTKAPKKKKKKKSSKSSKRKKKHNPIVNSFLGMLPSRKDKPLEITRKIAFLVSIVVIAGCIYAILNYFIGLFIAREKYDAIKDEVSPFIDSVLNDDDTVPEVPVYEEYLDMNDIGRSLYPNNPDTVGYIIIEGTKVCYPVVQRKSADINVNTNDYYLYTAFDGSHSNSGCIFMDYRCHFDEVVNHRRIVKNSDNLLIYGHNMKNESMFGCLRNYWKILSSNPERSSYYSEHPIIILNSLYKTYRYKIFAVLLVDGGDMTSANAFDCWNTFDFENEDAFYQFVNNAKRRNIVNNQVDVAYGDQLLTLYTCSTGTFPNAKLIVMARQLRPNEDPLEGTQNAYLNDNILWPTVYNKYHKDTYDESKFVPYN